jgi:hypothetical protein
MFSCGMALAGEPPALLLSDLAGRSGWLGAHCGCGRRAALDAGAWLAQGLADAPLDPLERRLRCVCGARRARLVADPTGASVDAGGGIFPFR